MKIRSLKMLLVFVAAFFLFNQCTHQNKPAGNQTPAYNPGIAAFTSGMISNESSIKVRLSSDYSGDISFDKPVSQTLFSFDPDIKGQTYWLDRRTLEFRPSGSLPPGTKFDAVFMLDKLQPGQKKDHRFKFSFNTFPLNIDVSFEGLRPYNNSDLSLNHIDGKIRATDKISPSDIEKMVTATQDNHRLPLSWEHAADGTEHHFTIDSVLRKDVKETVVISWDGSASGIDAKGSREYEIPSLSSFVLMEHEIVQQPQQYILLRFSDPILSTQSLEGLISLANNTSLKFTVSDNEVKAYPVVRQYGTVNLTISPGIKNVSGYRYDAEQTISLGFEQLKPAVRLIGEGVIIPESDGLLFPFEAVNLKAVDVKIIKIYEDNVAQFLQVNSLKGNNELKRAGRLILKKTVNLIPERPINFGEWNAFSLDLSKLIQTDPGAIYRVELSFRKKHSLYQCAESEPAREDLTSNDDDFETIDENELAYWDAYTNYNPDYSSYSWNERNDPCSDSYYNYYGHRVSRNVLASNLGIIAKQGEDNSMLFAVTDLRTTEPIKDVKLDIFNYQQQLLGSLTTDNQGIATIKLDKQPWLLVARKDNQRGYLRIDQRSAISLSQFDVSGAHTRKGVKGFIYGERGVWRPGDTLHLTFILEDKSNTIPDDHPVVFELTDPLGKMREKITRTSGMNGVYYFPVATLPDDPTGTWNAKISVGGLSFFKPLRVETVKPNRLKIHLNFKEDMILSGEEAPEANLSVTWLHGAVAGNMRARVDVNYSKRRTTFEGFKGYSFTDLTKSFNPDETVIFEGKTDSEGKASFTPSFDVGDRAPGMLNAIFTTRVFEQGGDFSIDRFTIPYSPYPVYIGLKAPEGDRFGMLQTDTLQEFSVVSLDQKGNPVQRKNLDVRVYKLNWRWWWHSSNENLASFTGNSSHEAVYKTTVNTGADGRGMFHVKINYPDWGRFLVIVKDPRDGHSTSKIVYFDWPGYAGRAGRSNKQAASILPFSSDKTKYDVGETAKITIPTSSTGRILLSIESGTRVIDHYWLEATGKETSFSFTVTPDMAPNVYVNVSLVQPHAQTKNDLPIRMYGVIPIMVEDPETHLHPVIDLPDVLRPESEATIKVSERNGKAMTYTIAIVDEGILDLTHFSTPDPWHTFYAREALGVKTFDLYNLVLGAYGGRIDGVFSIGGGEDEENAGNSAKRANRFPPVVKFLGPYHLRAGREKEHQIKIPNYIGSVRTMIVAAENGAYGSAEETIPVRKPLMVISTLPRVLSPGENVSLPVTVFAMEDQIKDVTINIEANDLFEAPQTSRKVHFDATGEQTFNFDIKVKEITGIGKIRVNVQSGRESAYYDTELEVRSPNPEVTEFVYGVIDPGETWEKSFRMPGMDGTNKGILEVSSIPPMDFGRRLKYLVQYPHGCIEQVTSAAFPQLYLENVMDVSNWDPQVVSRNVKAAIEKLGKFILPSGGFGYWPNSTVENEWGTCYAGHFLLEAREHGYDVPESWLSGWRRYQRKMARSWRASGYKYKWQKSQYELIQAYRLYTLALAQDPVTGAMNRLRETPGLDHIARWRLAAAYVLAGQKEQAAEMVRTISTEVDPVYHTEYTFGSGLRDKAMILETMNLLGQREQAVPIIQYISDRLSSGKWYSTQTTAYALLAVSEFLGKDKMSNEVNYDFHFENEKSQHASTANPVSEIHREFKGTNDKNVRVKNAGKGTLFVRLTLSGTPLAGKELAKSSNLGLNIEYRNMNGSALNVDRLEQGTDFVVVVTVSNPGSLGNYSNLALTQLFPSGWEIQNMRMFGSNLGNYDSPDYQDIRDDRVYSYFDLAERKSKQFVLKLTATYKGRFYLPGVSCDAMYNNDITAVVPGKWIEVVAPGEL